MGSEGGGKQGAWVQRADLGLVLVALHDRCQRVYQRAVAVRDQPFGEKEEGPNYHARRVQRKQCESLQLRVKSDQARDRREQRQRVEGGRILQKHEARMHIVNEPGRRSVKVEEGGENNG